jgi:hypothetical protein
MQDAQAIHVITSCLLSKWITTKRLTLELLSVICYLNCPDGHNSILNEMCILKNSKENGQFQHLLEFTHQKSKDLAMKGTLPDREEYDFLVMFMIFINALIDGAENLDMRIYIRNKLWAFHLKDILDHVRKMNIDTLNRQLESFEDELNNDREILSSYFDQIQIDFHDPEQLLSLFLKSLKQTEDVDLFVSLIQYLLLIKEDIHVR